MALEGPDAGLECVENLWIDDLGVLLPHVGDAERLMELVEVKVWCELGELVLDDVGIEAIVFVWRVGQDHIGTDLDAVECLLQVRSAVIR